MDCITLANILCDKLKQGSPIRTGRLRFYSIRVVKSDVKRSEVQIGQTGTPAAKYAFYTNAPWLSAKWKGKKNPNEGWVQNAVLKFANIQAVFLGGKVNVVIGG